MEPDFEPWSGIRGINDESAECHSEYQPGSHEQSGAHLPPVNKLNQQLTLDHEDKRRGNEHQVAEEVKNVGGACLISSQDKQQAQRNANAAAK